MQTHGGEEAERAILADERQFFVELKFDWDNTGNYSHILSDMSSYVSDISVDRSLAGSAPEELMLIEGASAAELTVTLGGGDRWRNNLNFVATFSPYNGLSDLYDQQPIGSEVTYRLGVETETGVVWYPQFVGNVRTITPNRQDNSVTITALDRVEKLRVPVKFPAWSLHNYWSDRGWTLAQLAYAHSVIDHCLRYANVSPTPTTPYLNRPSFPPKLEDIRDVGTQFFLTGNGGHAPLVGWVDQARRQGYPRTESGGPNMYTRSGELHPDLSATELTPFSFNGMGSNASGNGGFNSGLDFDESQQNTAEVRYWMRDRVNNSPNSTYWAGFTLNTNGQNGNWFRSGSNTSYVADFFIGEQRVIRLALMSGSFRVEVRNHSTPYPFAGVATSWKPVPTGIDHVHINVRVNGVDPANTFVSIDIEGTQYLDENLGNVARDSGSFDNHSGLVIVRHHVPISDVYFVSRYYNFKGNFNVSNQAIQPAQYAAVLDEGLNQLTHFPDTDYEDAWQVITDVAAAELGSVFWDEEGVFHFWNRQTLLAKQDTLVRTLSIDEVTGLAIMNSLDSVRTVISASSKLKTSDNNIVYHTQAVDELYAPPFTAGHQLKVYIEGVESVDPNKLKRYSTTVGNAYGIPVWDSDGSDSAYVVQFFESGYWHEMDQLTDGVDVQTQLDADGRLTLYVWNGYGYPARFASGKDIDESPSPALRVAGTLQTDWGDVLQQTQDDSAVEKFGKRNLPLSGDWIQWQPDIITKLIEYVLDRTVDPIPTTDAITVAGDPRLQLGDCLQIVDPDGLGEEMRVQVYGVSRKFSADGGLEDTLTVEMLRPSGLGIWDSAQYGLWDQTFIWSD